MSPPTVKDNHANAEGNQTPADCGDAQGAQVWRDLTDALPWGVFRLSVDEKRLDCNPALLRLLDCSDSAAVLAAGDQSLLGWAEIRSLLQGERDSIVDAEICLDPTRDKPWVRLTANALCDDAGSVRWVQGAVVTFTGRRQRHGVRQALSKLLGKLSAATTTEEVAALVRDTTSTLFEWDAHYLALHWPDRPDYEILSMVDTLDGERVAVSETQWTPPAAESPLQSVWEGRPLRIAREPGDEEPRLTRFGDTTRPSACMLYAPLRAGDDTFGVLSVQSYTPNRYSERDLRTLCRLAAVVAPALRRISAEEVARKLNQRVVALNEVANQLALIRSDDELCRQAVELGAKKLALDRLTIWRVGTDAAQLIGPWGVDASGNCCDPTSQPVTVTSGSAFHQVLSGQAPLIHEADIDLYGPAGTPLGSGEQLTVPVTDGDWRAGLMVLQREASAPLITPSDQHLLVAYAATIGRLLSRNRAEAAIHSLLAKERERLLQMVESLPEGVCLLDADRRVLLTNPKASEHLALLTDASPEQPLADLGGVPVTELLAPAGVSHSHEITVAGDPPRVFEVQLRALTETKSGAEQAWVLVTRETTSERESQQRLQQHSRLAAVGQLAAGIAHDFNNLLTAVVGYTQMLLLREDVTEEVRQRLRVVEQQGLRASQMVRQILDFSRRSRLVRRPLDLAPLVKETVQLLRQTLRDDLKVTLDLAPGRYLVEGDVGQLQQVLTNLALNAQDAMPKGGQFSLHLERRPAEVQWDAPFPDMVGREWIVLSATDTGKGMSPETTARVFEPFFTTKEVGEGTGLGLAQAYGIAKQHGGYLFVESEVEVGSTFTLYLPALPEDALPPPEARSATPPRGRDQTILVVEDDESVVAALEAMLEILGYRVLTAENGVEALKIYDAQPREVALVLSDMLMPEMGGVELYHKLRQRDESVKLVLMTGYAMEAESPVLADSGIVACLQKPLRLEELADVIANALQRPSTAVGRWG